MFLFVHIVFGTAALAAGAAGLSVRKGSSAHGRIGTVFTVSMLGMALTGAAIAALTPERGTAAIGLFTAYLVATSWSTARRRDGKAGVVEILGVGTALTCAAAFISFAILAAASPTGRLDSLPAAAHYPFAALAVLAAVLDLNYILRPRISAKQRLTRHLWRMCTAFLIAAFSFFIGQQDVMPAALRGSALLFVPPALILMAMLYWIARLRLRAISAALRAPHPKVTAAAGLRGA